MTYASRRSDIDLYPVREVGLFKKLLRRYFCIYQVLRRLSGVTYEVQYFDPRSRRKKQKILFMYHIGNYIVVQRSKIKWKTAENKVFFLRNKTFTKDEDAFSNERYLIETLSCLEGSNAPRRNFTSSRQASVIRELRMEV